MTLGNPHNKLMREAVPCPHSAEEETEAQKVEFMSQLHTDETGREKEREARAVSGPSTEEAEESS